jgi:hypothetical protein
MECRFAGETEVLGDTLPQRHFCPSQKSHMTRPGFEPGPPRWEAGDYFFILLLFGLLGYWHCGQPQVIVKMIVEKQMECRLAGETEVLGDNRLQRHFCPSQNPT